MKKKLSIVIPVFNVESRIEHLLLQIISVFPDELCEIILIDDGSTDKSLAIIKKYNQYENIIIISIENGGQSNARNIGIKKAVGEYIYFIDSDDSINEDSMEKIIHFFSLNYLKYDLFIFGYSKVIGNQISDRTMEEDINDKNIINSLFFSYESDPIGGYVWNKIIKTSLIKDREFKSMKYEDIPFIYQTLLSANKPIYVAINGYNYLYNSNSTVNTYSESLLQDRIKSLNLLAEMVKKDTKDYKMYRAYCLNALIFLYDNVYNDAFLKKYMLGHLKKINFIEITTDRDIKLKKRVKYILIRIKIYDFFKICKGWLRSGR